MRLPMIEGEDEYAQKNKGGPLRVHRSYSKLIKKKQTNRRSHEDIEQRIM